jgi:hypothetical protein
VASNIKYLDIDEAFPIAGIDNESQGFRDNFKFIKDSLGEAKAEIEDLQDTTLKNNSANYANFNTLQKVQLQEAQLAFNSLGNVGTAVDLDYNRGHFQALELNYNVAAFPNGVTVTIREWPDNGLAKVQVAMTSFEGATRKIIWASENAGNIKTSQAWKNNLVNGEFVINSSTDVTIVEFYTYDGGRNVFADFVGQFS